MEKRIFSVLLAVIMIMALVPASIFSAFAVEPAYELIIEDGVLTGYTGTLPANLVIPNGVIGIGGKTFVDDCPGFKSVTIPDSVTFIGGLSFACANLENITVDANNEVYSSDEYGVLFDKYKTDLIQYPLGNRRTSYKIPDSVTNIEAYAFSDCTSLKNVIIPNSVTTIENDAFSYCQNLESAIIPDSVTEIEGPVFCYCTNLVNITVDPNNERYSNDEYGVLFNKNKTELIQYPLGNTRTSYKIPNGVKEIGYEAFRGCSSLKSVTIPDSVTSIEGGAFADCANLTGITIPDNVKRIGSGAFDWCTSLTSITIPDGVTSLENSVFYHCTNLKSIKIPDSVTSIEFNALAWCTGLTSITIPESIISINEYAFYCCSKNLIIYGVSGSKAEKYAKDNGMRFVHSESAKVSSKPVATTNKSSTKPNDSTTVLAESTIIPNESTTNLSESTTFSESTSTNESTTTLDDAQNTSSGKVVLSNKYIIIASVSLGVLIIVAVVIIIIKKREKQLSSQE